MSNMRKRTKRFSVPEEKVHSWSLSRMPFRVSGDIQSPDLWEYLTNEEVREEIRKMPDVKKFMQDFFAESRRRGIRGNFDRPRRTA